jgi:hypothetical protein
MDSEPAVAEPACEAEDLLDFLTGEEDAAADPTRLIPRLTERDPLYQSLVWRAAARHRGGTERISGAASAATRQSRL